MIVARLDAVGAETVGELVCAAKPNRNLMTAYDSKTLSASEPTTIRVEADIMGNGGYEFHRFKRNGSHINADPQRGPNRR